MNRLTVAGVVVMVLGVAVVSAGGLRYTISSESPHFYVSGNLLIYCVGVAIIMIGAYLFYTGRVKKKGV